MILALTTDALAPMPVGHPLLAAVLAWIGLAAVIGGFITMYAWPDSERAEHTGYVVLGMGAVACFAALVVAP